MEILKDMTFKDLHVIGQSAECEIIFCYYTKKRRVICFDQHAADERVRYETLLRRVNPEGIDLDQLKTIACKGAVRFGTKLTYRECYLLIKDVMNCKVPYRCAHSRQGVAVLDNLDKIIYKDEIKVISRFIKTVKQSTAEQDQSQN